MEQPKEPQKIPELNNEPAPEPMTPEELKKEAEKSTGMLDGIFKLFSSKKKEKSGEETLSNDGVKRLGVVALLCVVVVFAMGYLGVGSWVTKNAFNVNYLALQEQVTATDGKTTATQTQLDNAIQSIPELVNTAILTSNEKITSDFTKIQQDMVGLLNTINNSPFDYTSQISNLQTELASLQGQINALKAGGLLDWNGILSVNATVLEVGRLSGNVTISRIKVTLKNLTDKNLENISVTIPCTLDNTKYEIRPTVHSSGWYVSEWDGGIFELRSLSSYSLLKYGTKEIELEIHSEAQDGKTMTGIFESGIKVNTFGYK